MDISAMSSEEMSRVGTESGREGQWQLASCFTAYKMAATNSTPAHQIPPDSAKIPPAITNSTFFLSITVVSRFGGLVLGWTAYQDAGVVASPVGRGA